MQRESMKNYKIALYIMNLRVLVYTRPYLSRMANLIESSKIYLLKMS